VLGTLFGAQLSTSCNTSYPILLRGRRTCALDIGDFEPRTVRELRHIIYTPACFGVQDWTCPYAHRVLRSFHTWLSFISTSHILRLHFVCGNGARGTCHIWQKSIYDIHELWLLDWFPFAMNEWTLTSNTHVQQHSIGVFALRGLRKHAIACISFVLPQYCIRHAC
jgi:hypothetical protein